MTEAQLTLETKVWEQDYDVVLSPSRLARWADAAHGVPAHRVLYVNNVERPGRVMDLARRRVRAGLADEVYLVEEHADAALAQVDLTRADLGRGLVYSLAEIVGLVLCRTPYLLHLSGDSRPAGRYPWVGPALDRLERDPQAAVANLLWDHDDAGARAEATSIEDDFYVGQGFSDQMYLVRAPELAAPVYHHRHPESERYPEYGGELFEKRVDAWMRTHDRRRLTWRHGSYLHENIPARHRRRAVSRLRLRR